MRQAHAHATSHLTLWPYSRALGGARMRREEVGEEARASAWEEEGAVGGGRRAGEACLRRTASRLKRPLPPRTCLPSPPPRVSTPPSAPTPCAHPKPLHHGKLTPKRSEPSRCVIASSWSKSCPRASLPGLHDSNGMKPYICFCTRRYPCLCANTHTHKGARLAGGAIGAREPPPSSASRLVLRMSSPLLAPLPLDHPPLRCPMRTPASTPYPHQAA
jgi:hypothetical protein